MPLGRLNNSQRLVEVPVKLQDKQFCPNGNGLLCHDNVMSGLCQRNWSANDGITIHAVLNGSVLDTF